MDKEAMAAYCNFQISPPKKNGGAEGNRRSARENELARPQYLILGAFTSTPKLHFERLQVGLTRNRVLVVRNPTNLDIWFEFTKMPPSTFDMTCSETASGVSPGFELEAGEKVTIPAQGQLTVTIKWSPTQEGRCFEVLKCKSGLSAVTLTIHLLGEAEPGPKIAKGRSGLLGRRSGLGSNSNLSAAHSLTALNSSAIDEVGFQAKPKELLREKTFPGTSFEQTQIRRSAPSGLNTDSVLPAVSSVSSPSRRETYLVTPTANKAPLCFDISAALSGFELKFDDDEFKENESPLTDFVDSAGREAFYQDEIQEQLFVDDYAELQTDMSTNKQRRDSASSMSTTWNQNSSHDTREIGHVQTPVTYVSKYPNGMMDPFDDQVDLQDELLEKGFAQIDSLLAFLKTKPERTQSSST